MTITEADRHRLHQALVTQLGEAEAATLMEHLPPTGWADVATKTDLAHLQTAVDARFDHFQTAVDARFGHFQTVMDARFDHFEEVMDARFGAVDTRFDHLQTVMDARFDTFGATMDARSAAMDAKLEAKFTSHVRWMIGTIFASYALVAAVAGIAL